MKAFGENVLRTYAGHWDEFCVNPDALSIQGKIFRLMDLDRIYTSAEKRLKKRWYWLLLPLLVFLYTCALNVRYSFQYLGIPALVMLFAVWGLVALVHRVVVLPGDFKNHQIKRLMVVLLLWLACLLWPVMAEEQFAVLSGTVFLSTVLLAILYINFAGKGFREQMVHADAEREVLTKEICRDIDHGPLRAEQLKNGVVLGEDEIPLLEVDAVLLEVQERPSQPISNAQPNLYATVFNNDWFKNFRNQNQTIDQTIQSVQNYFSKNAKKATTHPGSQFVKYTPPKNESVGRLILTQKRILFVDCIRGFQIHLRDLVSFGMNPDRPGTISFQSQRSIRVVATDVNIWIKRYLTRLVREERRAK